MKNCCLYVKNNNIKGSDKRVTKDSKKEKNRPKGAF